jgi:hypothetical protein
MPFGDCRRRGIVRRSALRCGESHRVERGSANGSVNADLNEAVVLVRDDLDAVNLDDAPSRGKIPPEDSANGVQAPQQELEVFEGGGWKECVHGFRLFRVGVGSGIGNGGNSAAPVVDAPSIMDGGDGRVRFQGLPAGNVVALGFLTVAGVPLIPAHIAPPRI